jgi:hypothetical protein
MTRPDSARPTASSTPVAPLDLGRVKVLPLASRQSLTRVEDILVAPDSAPAPLPNHLLATLDDCARKIREARARDAAVLLLYGAHLLRNGAALIIEKLLAQGWITHLATNGAGSIHDWEYAFLGRSTESVQENVATGTFGTWDETGRNIHIALMAGGLSGEGYGRALGRFIVEGGTTLPMAEELEKLIRSEPGDPRTPARADLLQVLQSGRLLSGPIQVPHRWQHASILAQAFRHRVPLTVHPGIGYDIISNHPLFNGAVIGRAAELDFKQFAGSVERLDGGVVLSIGSAIMAPQVFEKSLSCVNNLRLQDARDVVQNYAIYVVDLQDGGRWDWSKGEPPKTNPAYYLRFCKSFSRMGGVMQYAQCDNVSFVHQLYRALSQASAAGV